MQAQRLQLPTGASAPARVARVRRLAVAGDAAARVRGDAKRVQRWLSDVRHWGSFYPGTKSAVKVGNGLEPVRVGSKFETQRDMLGLKLPMTYEVLEVDPGRRLVLSGLSEHHTQMDQFFFMQDRHDANFCCVRYITDVRLREWRVYMQPLATRFASKVPEEAMANLQRALNTPHSPIFSADFEQRYRQELRSSASSSSSSSRAGTSGSRGGSRGGTESSRPGANGAKKGLGSGWLKNMFTGSFSSVDDDYAGSGSSGAGHSSSSSSSGMPDSVVLDPMGYYTILGLAPNSELDEDAIKAAYRRLALQLHPDRHVGKDAAARAAAAEQFARLLRAYDTLRDPEQRALYNQGQIIEASLKL